MRRIAILLAAATGAVVWTASAAGGVHVSLAGATARPTAGKAWTARLAVRPVSYRGAVRVTASGPGRVDVRASGGHGSYRARLVFPAAGRWTLTARAGGATSHIGSVTVRKAAPVPLAFVWPTSVDVEPGGSLLVVENGLSRLVRVSTSGRVTEIASLTKAYAVRRAPSGALYVNGGPALFRIEGTAVPVKVAEAESDIGPMAIAPNGDVYFTTETKVWRLAGGKGVPVRLAAGTTFSAPHGLAVASDGSLLVADTGNHLIRRVDPSTRAVTTFAALDDPRGIEAASDGTVYVVDAGARRILHLSASGARLGFASPVLGDPYDLALASGGVIYVVDTAQSGHVMRVAADGTTTVSRPAR
jgi:sugar lactone lactonase YvrE